MASSAPSFVPPTAIQELRDLTRTRKQLTREIVQHVQRIQAVLEEANVKLCSVITDIMGASGRRMLKAMITGETDAEKLAALGHERLGCTRSELVEVLTGCVREHHRFLLAQHLRTIEQLEDSIAAFDARIEAALSPFDPSGYPTKPLASFRINRQLSGWNLPPLMIRAFGAHCQ
jgi:transposase